MSFYPFQVLEIAMKNFLFAIPAVLFSGWLFAGPVDMNAADAETIARELNGIGAARAQAIVDYRSEFGRFETADDLLNVGGIGPHTLEVNRTNIVIGQER
jgi:competence protein ComEA